MIDMGGIRTRTRVSARKAGKEAMDEEKLGEKGGKWTCE